MSLFVTKWLVSRALDSGRPMSARLREKIAAKRELQIFVERPRLLGRHPHTTFPSGGDLHGSIMAAVHASTSLRRSEPRSASLMPWLSASVAAGGMAMVATWWTAAGYFGAGVDSPAPLGDFAQVVRRSIEGFILP